MTSKAAERRENYYAYIHSPAWQVKRQMAFVALGRRCSECEATDNLQVHHKTYERFGGDEILADLMVLCEPCHLSLHKVRRSQKKRSKPEIGFYYRGKLRQRQKSRRKRRTVK